jgi:trans-aconitate methyltransferase
MTAKRGRRLRAAIAAGLEERIALMAPSRRLRFALAEQAIAAFARERPIRILDAGCGDGLLSISLAQRHPSWTVVGMDRDSRLLSGAVEREKNRGLGNVTFMRADLTQPLPDSGFDVVMAIECLSEIRDDRGALRMLHDAVTPQGLFVAQVPDERWKPVLPGSPNFWREEVRHGYSATELAEALRDAGFGDVNIRPTFRSIVAVAQEIRDRIKGSRLAIRAAAFPFFAAAVRLERWGFTWGGPNALFAVARPSTS